MEYIFAKVRNVRRQHPSHVMLASRLLCQTLTYVKKNGLEKEVVILVLELAVGGELFDFMMYTGAFPEVIARTYFLQVRRAPGTPRHHIEYFRYLPPRATVYLWK